MWVALFGSVRDLGTSAPHSTANQCASRDGSQSGDSETCSAVRTRIDIDDALARSRRRTVSLLNLLKYAETEAVEQELQTAAVLLDAAIADVAQRLKQDKL